MPLVRGGSRMMKPNPLPFVLVYWLDAWKASTEDATAENAADSHKPVECCTAGWVLLDNEKGIQLGSEYSPDGTHRNRSFIHRPMILSVVPVTLTKPRVRGRKTPKVPQEP